MNVRFTIGEFAKLCGVSKQTLIFYDKKGIICPVIRDSRNGYRYYAAEQLEQMDSILVLREMGLSLEEIREHMRNRSLQNSLELMENQREAIHAKIHALQMIEKRIERKTESIRLFCSQDASFEIRELPEQFLAVAPVKNPAGILEVDIALKKLMKKMKDDDVEYIYEVGDIIPEESLREGKFLHFKWAFLPLENPCEDMKTIEKPAGSYAVQCHLGPYNMVESTYRKMLSSIRDCGKEVAGDAYEFCILDSLTTSSPENYCTQIHIPVRDKKD